MNTPKPTFVREVARIEDPQFVSGQAAGHCARRLIDAPDAAFADPFVLMAEDWTSQGAFAFHPHRGIETVTFVIEGAIEHRDSAGFGGVIHAGGAQWMTAGRGVQHEENPPAGTTAHTLQLWVNLPAAEKMAVPRNQDLEVSALPVRSENGVEIRVFSGAYGGPDTGHWRHLADLSAIGQSTVGGAEPTPAKKLKGARLAMPSASMVETRATGRGTIMPVINL